MSCEVCECVSGCVCADAGTPWSVVWTTDERQFFFDASSRVSLWILPEELKENPHVHRIIENGPNSDSRWRESAGVLYTER